MAQAIALVVAESVGLFLAALAFIGFGIARLGGRLGLHREGLSPGARSPRWSQPDLDGTVRAPGTGRWQLLLFADHSLCEFPGAVSGLRALVSEESVEVLLVTRTRPEVVREAVATLRLDVPIIPVAETFYHRHNVRVMPFVIVLDPAGVVRASGLVNRHETVLRMWEIAQVLAAPRNIPATAAGVAEGAA